MPIRFHCPNCRVRLSIANRKAGTRAACPKCGIQVRIPDASVLESESSQSEFEFATDDSSRLKPEAAAVTKGTSQQYLRSSDSPAGSVSAADSDSDMNLRADSESLESNQTANSLVISRWVVYCQGALLGIVATTFFLFGLMIGQVTSPGTSTTITDFKCGLTGKVLIKRDGEQVGDEGAVLMFLPEDKKLSPSPELATLRPNEFQPLENPAIEQIEAVGGRVIRIDQNGEFDLQLQGPHTYNVLVISNKSKRASDQAIPKILLAEIGQYFYPADDLIQNHDYSWTKIDINRKSQRLKTIVF